MTFGRRAALIVAWGGVAFLAGSLGVSALSHPFFRDELQCLHAAWNVRTGMVPYRDFWENHTPLTWYALQPWLAALPADEDLLVAVRMTFSVPIALGLLAALARLAWLRLRDGFWTAVALLFVASNPVFWSRAIEVRPDHLLWLCWYGGLWLVADRPERPGRWLACGALLGLGFWSTPKALPCLAALAAALAVHAWWIRLFEPPIGTRTALARGGLLSAGFLVPCIPFAAGFASAGALDGLWEWIFRFNFVTAPKYPSATNEFLEPVQAALVALAIASLLGVRTRPASFLTVTGLAMTLLFALVLPRANDYTMLLFLPLLSIAAAELLKDLAARWQEAAGAKRRRLLRSALAAVMLGAFALIPIGWAPLPSICREGRGRLHKDRLHQADLLRLTPGGEPILDGLTFAVVRPQVGFFGNLVEVVIAEHVRGNLPGPGRPSWIESIERARPPLVVMDWRLRRILPSEDTAWIRRRYFSPHTVAAIDPELRKRLLEGNVLIAGREIEAHQFDDQRRARWTVPLSGRYAVEIDGGPAQAWINDRPCSSPIPLAADDEITLRHEGRIDRLRIYRAGP